MLRRVLLVLLSLSLAAPSVVASGEAATFRELVDDIGHTMLARYPEEATDLGLSRELGLDDTRLDDYSFAYLAETARLAQGALERLGAVDADALTPDERISLAVAEWYLDDLVFLAASADHEYALNFITGAHVDLPEFMADIHPLDDLDDARAYVQRLGAARDQLEQVGDRFRRSQAAGNLPTTRGLDIAAWQVGQQIVDAPEAHPLVTDFEARVTRLDLDPGVREELGQAAQDAVRDSVVPAYMELAQVLRGAATRTDERPGVLHHPGGRDYYLAVLRHHLSSPLTPDEVHDIGRAEVERVRGELAEALRAVGYEVETMGFARAIEAASRAASAVPLRSDEDRAELLAATEAFVVDSRSAFADMFDALPSAPLEVRRPRPGREGGAGAYYRPPPAVGERPGIYYLDLAGDHFALDTYATTNYHEAVPGHHFQLALQRGSETLPLLQRATSFTGYAEGWALYAERLAYEAGLYEDDARGNLGRLRMELLRAARAVADTGIHWLGWSRDEAVAYLVELGFPPGWAASEVDRYIVWPGQAPAYLVGMLEILRLRAVAQAALGDDFDVADFHDAVLRHGSVPLAVLPLAVDAYIESAPADAAPR
jgi:uncharacterized protein (DUF885 family)